MIRVLPLVLVFAATPAIAHQLNVFASVKGEEVTVEAKFSSGRVPVAGEVRVFDATGVKIDTLDLGEGGVLTFPLDPAQSEGGLIIEVEASDGHENYWLLTPDDISRGKKGN